MTGSQARERRRWSTGRKLALQVALLPVLLVSCELLFRGWVAAVDRPFSAVRARASIERVADQVNQTVDRYAPGNHEEDGNAVDDPDQRTIPHPFFAWDFASAQASAVTKVAYFRSVRANRHFDVVIVGGSVAHGFSWMGAFRLRELLDADPRFDGERVRIHGRAFGGAKQPQQLNLVAYLLSLGWAPDAVINLDGFNEVALSAQNAARHIHPLHPSGPHWERLVSHDVRDREALDFELDMRAQQHLARETAEWAIQWKLDRSAALSSLALRRLHGIRGEFSRLNELYSQALAEQRQSTATSSPPFEGTSEEALEISVQGWAEASRSLQAICEVRGIAYVHVLQPTLHDADSKPLTRDELETGTADPTQVEATLLGYPRLREVGQELLAQEVRFVDASRVFEQVEQTLYIDMCHFTQAGHELLAEPIARALLAAVPSPTPPAWAGK